MVPLPTVPKTLKLTHQFSLGADSNVLSLLHWEYTGGPPSATDCLNIAAAASNYFKTNCQGLMPSNCNAVGVTCLDIDSTTGNSAFFSNAYAGTIGGALYPGSLCSRINYSIPNRYRGGKPKGFWPFGDQAQMSSPQAWIGTFIANVNAAFDAFITAFLTETSGTTSISKWVAVSYYSGVNTPTTLPSGRVKQSPKLRAGGPVKYYITGPSMAARPGSQRRRN